MSQFVLKHDPANKLRVAIVSPNAARRAELQAAVTSAGHAVVELRDADIVVFDGAAEVIDKPAIVLGAPNDDVAGSLPSDARPEQIDAALRAVAAGLVVRSPAEPGRRGFEELRERAAHTLLTPREMEVLTAIGEGFSNKAIARQLGISLHTVKFHIESVFRKLRVRTRAEAVAKSLERRAKDTIEL